MQLLILFIQKRPFLPCKFHQNRRLMIQLFLASSTTMGIISVYISAKYFSTGPTLWKNFQSNVNVPVCWVVWAARYLQRQLRLKLIETSFSYRKFIFLFLLIEVLLKLLFIKQSIKVLEDLPPLLRDRDTLRGPLKFEIANLQRYFTNIFQPKAINRCFRG